MNRTFIMLKLSSFAPEISIQTDCYSFRLIEQIGKKVVVFFPRAGHSTVPEKPHNSPHQMMLLPRKKL